MQIQLLPWCILTGCSIAAGILCFYRADRQKHSDGKSLRLSLLLLCFGLLLGALFARGLWVLFRWFMHPQFFSFRLDELSWYGGVAGTILAAALSARLAGRKVCDTLNTFAPVGAMLVAAFRFGEGFIGSLGFGRYVDKGVFFPITVEVIYDAYYSEYYWAVFMLEGFLALIAMVFSIFQKQKADRFLRTLFWICLPQILCESLRIQSIRWLFIRAEQLISFLICEGILILYAVLRNPRKLRSWIPVIVGLAVCGLAVAVEFALDAKILIDGHALPRLLLYSILAAGLSVMAVAEHKSRLVR